MFDPLPPTLAAVLSPAAPGWTTVTGPPGCGRSAALATLSAKALAQGEVVLSVQALDGEVPLGTLQRLLDGWSRAAETVSAARGLGALAALVPRLGEAEEAATEASARLQGELCLLLGRLGGEAPPLLVVDDLHRADGESLGLIVAAHAAGAARVVASWCAEDAEPPGASSPVAGAVCALPPRDTAPSPQRLQGRLARLGEGARGLLDGLVVVRQPVEIEELAALRGVDVDALEGDLDELVGRGWARLEAAGAALLVHPPTEGWMAALDGGLSPLVRRRLAARWSSVLAAREAPVERRARMLAQAGTAAEAGSAAMLRQAAEGALRADRPEEALEWLEMAADLARRADGEVDAALLLLLGQAQQRVGDREGAGRSWQAALNAAPTPAQVASLRRLLALLAWDMADFDLALEHLRMGREAKVQGPDAVALLRAELVLLGRRVLPERLPPVIEALAPLVSPDDPAACSDLAQARGVYALFMGQGEVARQHIEVSIQWAEQVEEPITRARARHARAMILLSEGWPRLAEEAAAETAKLQDFAGMLYGYFSRTLSLVAQGRWDEAMATTIPSPENLPPRLQDSNLLHELQISLRRGALLTPKQRAALGADLNLRTRLFVSFFHTEEALLREDFAGVEAAMEDARLRREGGVAGNFPEHSCFYLGLALLGMDREDDLRDLIAEMRGRSAFCVLLADILAGLLDEDFSAVEASVTRLEERRAIWLASFTRVLAAERQPDPSAARQLADKAWRVLAPLSAAPLLGRLREVYRRLGQRPPTTPRRGGGQAGLSGREVEVVRLVARGMSNKEVAAALFISPATVSTHLKRLYRRLELHSRAALTRWAAENDLLPLPQSGDSADAG